MAKIIAEVSIVPLGTATSSLSRFVADIEKEIRNSRGIESQLTPMSTILEGEWQAVMELISRIQEIPFQMGAERVSTWIHIDDRRDKELSMQAKIEAVESKI